MPSLDSIRQSFRSTIQSTGVDLAKAALLIALEDEQNFELDVYMRRLHDLGRRAAALVAGAAAPLARIEALNRLLFGEEQFRGNDWDYHDPRNSFLNQVLDRRVGIPVSLSLVYLEVGRRAGIAGLSGVALPGHFMVRAMVDGQPIFIDPFNRGSLRSAAECRRYVASRFGPACAAREELYQPVSPQHMLLCLLRHLKAIYLRQADAPRALAAVERILLLEPDAPQEVRDRGLLRLRRGDLLMGLNDLERYGLLAPQAIDLEDIRQQAEGIAGFLAPRN